MDKGFVYVVPMRRKSEVLKAIKQFAKEIGAPTSIIAGIAGEQMSQDGRVVPRRSLRLLTIAKIHSPVEEMKQNVFDALIDRRMGTSINPPPTMDETSENDLDNNWETTPMDELAKSPDHEDILDSTGRTLEQQLAFDKIINAEVMIQNGNEMAMGKVARQSLDADGRTTGTYHDNPFLNTVMYDVEFSNVFTQVDLDGYSLSLMDSIIDHRKDPSQEIPIEDKYIITKSGQRRLHKTMKGWKLLIKWKKIQGMDQSCRHERGTSS